MISRLPRPSRRTLLYLVVAFQLLLVSGIVAFHELNRALDGGPSVDLEIPHATGSKDPFRGASVSGRPVLNLKGPNVAVPAGLSPGDEVLVFFTVELGQPPHVVQVARRGWGPDPVFRSDIFSIPGRVVTSGRGRPRGGGRRISIEMGHPALDVELDLPDSIPVADGALDDLTSPALVRASLRRGALGYRFLTDLRLAGQNFSFQTSFAYDVQRERLIVLAGKGERYDRRPRPRDQPPRSSVFVFDGTGNEVGLTEITGHILEGTYTPSDETLLALLSQEHYVAGPAQLTRLRDDGTVVRRSPEIHSDRILGVDRETGDVWALIGTPMASPQPPFIVQRFGLDGFGGPRIGPVASRPRSVLGAGQSLWIVETDRHLVSRYTASGALAQEYRDLNHPTEIALDDGSLLVAEANQTQLTRFAPDGRVLWRVPRFQGLSWILPQPGTGSGWVAAARYDNAPGGVFRYEADGRITRLPHPINPRPGDWARGRLAGDVIGDLAHKRFYVRESQSIAIVGTDGTLIRRVEGFRFPTARPLSQ